MRRWSPGEPIVVREVWRGRVWSGRPFVLVQDRPDLLAMFMPAGTAWKKPTTLTGGTLRMPREEWALADARHPHNMLVVATPGADHSVRLIWTEEGYEFVWWYVNFEEPLARTEIGFDYMDQVLDMVARPDLSEWRWKDEDELEEAQALGIVSPARALELRAEGERVIGLIEGRRPPFDGSWREWRPDPAWPVPVLPDGWYTVGLNEAPGRTDDGS